MSDPKRVPIHPDGYKAEAYAIAEIFGWGVRNTIGEKDKNGDILHQLSFLSNIGYRISFTDRRSGRVDLDEFSRWHNNYAFDKNYNTDSLKEEGITNFDDWLFSSLVWAIRERERKVNGVIYEPIAYSSMEELKLKAIAQGLVS